MERDLAVIIINWNTKDLLRQCIDAVRTNTRRLSVQIIVVDNQSRDGSPEMVERDFPEVLLIKNKVNRGYGGAGNQGLEAARGKYALILNSDVKVNPHCLDGMFEFMESRPDIGASSCRLTFPDGTLQHSCRKFPSFKAYVLMLLGIRRLFPNMRPFREYLMLDWDHSEIRPVDQIMGSFLFLRSRAVEQVGGFDERFWMYFEEVDLCLRIRKAGWAIVHYPYVSAVHFLSKSSEQWGEVKKIREYQKSLLKYFKKNGKVHEYYILLAVSRLKYWFLIPVLKLIKVPFQINADLY
ncbi:MAG: glycosyltransferase family 2 protein [Candidatus Aminicenantes bacterium]|nr:glycosyltransferase family 2 protein [Candidatus Aminicenantes bacterium]